MTALYSRFASRAADLLEKYGKTVTLTRAAGGTQTVKALEEAYEDKSVDGRVVEVGDVKLHMAVTSTAGAAVAKPEADADTVTYADGTVWMVKRVMPVSPADTAVLYTLQLRR